MTSKIVLAIDVGSPDFVGILDRQTRKYVPYWRSGLGDAVRRIEEAHEVITFKGDEYDLPRLAKYIGRAELSLSGVHTDMMSICWKGGYWGRGLRRIYEEHFGMAFVIPIDPYEANNKADCEMTLALWESWKQGAFKAVG